MSKKHGSFTNYAEIDASLVSALDESFGEPIGRKVGVLVIIRSGNGDIADMMCHSSTITEAGPTRGIEVQMPLVPVPEGGTISVKVFR